MKNIFRTITIVAVIGIVLALTIGNVFLTAFVVSNSLTMGNLETVSEFYSVGCVFAVVCFVATIAYSVLVKIEERRRRRIFWPLYQYPFSDDRFEK